MPLISCLTSGIELNIMGYQHINTNVHT